MRRTNDFPGWSLVPPWAWSRRPVGPQAGRGERGARRNRSTGGCGIHRPKGMTGARSIVAQNDLGLIKCSSAYSRRAAKQCRRAWCSVAMHIIRSQDDRANDPPGRRNHRCNGGEKLLGIRAGAAGAAEFAGRGERDSEDAIRGCWICLHGRRWRWPGSYRGLSWWFSGGEIEAAEGYWSRWRSISAAWCRAWCVEGMRLRALSSPKSWIVPA